MASGLSGTAAPPRDHSDIPPKDPEEEKRRIEAERKKEKKRKAHFKRIIKGINDEIKNSKFLERITIRSEVKTLAKLSDEKKLLAKTRAAVNTHNSEVDRIRDKAAFLEKLEKVRDNWPAIRKLLSGRSNLVDEHKKLLRRAELEEIVGVEISGRKILVDKYEVTNLQYRDFMDSGGYKKKEYWSDAGWKWKKKNNITQPAFWEDNEFNGDEQPVVGVSCYEAEAYAAWAGKHLPTAEEWRAAAGKDQWPWGNVPTTGYANTREKALNKTTGVGSFPSGCSAAGCMDLSGNAMEWCALSGTGRAPCLGGSWFLPLSDSKTTSQYMLPLDTRENYVGFRCAKEK